mmetsp:Transcript_1005/g.3411  ORF Transcript_1005/g.3411 Transcript_1005/m.3411 type:complete len:225 (-) Transcript_1005:14-688(-)
MPTPNRPPTQRPPTRNSPAAQQRPAFADAAMMSSNLAASTLPSVTFTANQPNVGSVATRSIHVSRCTRRIVFHADWRPLRPSNAAFCRSAMENATPATSPRLRATNALAIENVGAPPPGGRAPPTLASAMTTTAPIAHHARFQAVAHSAEIAADSASYRRVARTVSTKSSDMSRTTPAGTTIVLRRNGAEKKLRLLDKRRCCCCCWNASTPTKSNSTSHMNFCT